MRAGALAAVRGFMAGGSDDRAGENTEPLSLDKIDAVRFQSHLMDWTAQIAEDAEHSDLSPEAIAVVRRGFVEHNASPSIGSRRAIPSPTSR